MSCQQIREVMSLPPDPPHVNNNNYICLKYCPKGLDHLNVDSVYITKDGIVYTYYFNNVKMKTIDFNPEITSEASNTDDFTFIIPQFNQESSISGIIIRQFSDKYFTNQIISFVLSCVIR